MDIAEFIGARLDEDENYARSALAEVSTGKAVRVVDGELAILPSAASEWLTFHIVRHAPARVLRDVEAKRAILSVIGGTLNTYDGMSDYVADGLWRSLAATWDDHPDYKPRWKP